ncbi:MAG: hypothetical protein RMK57_15430 [Bryobacterales bacterium]|nr:hypothetical protein [Bryobacteraceae bacterium]MDW8355913.1 hypothetical protein [Bryobacterales bacterium]
MTNRQTRVLSVAGREPLEIREVLESPPDDIVVVYGFESFSQEDWQALDIHRDVLQREGPVVFWLSKKDANTLCRYAPNLRSLIGRSFFELGPEGGLMTEQERTKRLQVLAEHYGLTDQEVIRRAQAGELPRDPEFAEWLVLLGRGDLV